MRKFKELKQGVKRQRDWRRNIRKHGTGREKMTKRSGDAGKDG